MSNIDPRIPLMERAVLAAAKFLTESTPSSIKFEYKADASIVMNLDLESQRAILAVLGDSLPIVAEEDPSSHALIDSSDDYFLVDPLDGTTSCKRFFGIRGGQVGYGPLLGLVEKGKFVAGSFYSVPQRTLFTAIRDVGSFAIEVLDFNEPIGFERRRNLKISKHPPLLEAGVLFYPGKRGEVPIIEALRNSNVIENVYRFGGFANDCSRLAQGFEQICVQFSVKAWDFPAALLAREAGYSILMDPLGRKVPFEEWRIANENPLLIAPADYLPDLEKHITLK